MSRWSILLGLTFSLTVASESTYALPKLNQSCEAAGIARIFVSLDGMDAASQRIDPKFPETNYCLVSDSQIPPQIRSVIQQIGGLNSAVTEVLRTRWSDLGLGAGVDIFLQRSKLGPFGSYTDGKRIGMTIFPNWNGEALPAGIYVHELGHVLAMRENRTRIGFDPELLATPLMTETIADLLSLAAVGEVLGSDGDVHSCLSRSRYITTSQSYRFPRGYFTNTFSTMRTSQCCRSNPDRMYSPALASDVRNFCGLLGDQLSGMKLDRTPFDPLQYLDNRSKYDVHQIGIPINSFLLNLKKNGLPQIFQLFLDSYAEATKNPNLREVYVCSVPKLPILTPPRDFRRSTMRAVFRVLREKVKSTSRLQVFDRLWREHQLEKAMVISDREVAEQLEKPLILPMAKKGAQAMKRPELRAQLMASGCWFDLDFSQTTGQDLSGIDYQQPGCSIVCMTQNRR